MDLFNSLTLDLKILAAAAAGCVLLGLFAGNQKTERWSMIAFAVLTVAGAYRFTHLPAADQAHSTVSKSAVSQPTPAEPKRKPLESTFAK